MQFSHTRKIEWWLRTVDIVLVVLLWVIAFSFPREALMRVLGYTAVTWLCFIVVVGGQNARYLHPFWRIGVSMGLSLLFTATAILVWVKSGHEWFLPGSVLSFQIIAIAGTSSRLIIAVIFKRPAIQLIPCRLPAEFQPLLQEISLNPQVCLEEPVMEADDPLPPHRSGYPIYLGVSDLHLSQQKYDALAHLFARLELVDICDLYESITSKVAIVKTADGWHMPKTLRVPSPIRDMLKRLGDIIAVVVSAPLTVPVVGLAALAIKLTSPGPVFFRQPRVGRYGVPFEIIKLRTMDRRAEVSGRKWAGSGDPRVTPLGRFLRFTAIDELPQLWNVLRGEMSLIGPRPEVPEIVARLQQQVPFYSARLLTLPGLSGWAQLHQGGDSSIEDVAHKVRYDLYYLQYMNFLFDCRIFFATIQMLLHLAKPGGRGKAPSAPEDE